MVTGSDIQPETTGSDHCPVYADFLVETLPPRKSPKGAASNWPEFSGTQSTLHGFLQQTPSNDDDLPVDKAAVAETSHVDPDPPDESSDSVTVISSSKPLDVKKSAPVATPLRTAPAKRPRQSTMLDFIPKRPTPQVKPAGGRSDSSPVVVDSEDDEVVIMDEENGAERTPNKADHAMSSQWQHLFGPNAVHGPVCAHGEAAVVRQSRTRGQNYGRMFYGCRRPASIKGDQTGRCKFFQWQKDSRNKGASKGTASADSSNTKFGKK